MNQLSLYGDNDDNRGKYAENSKDCSLLSSISEVRELSREYFPLPPEKPPRLRRRRPATRKQRVQAARRGLVAKWSAEFGFISLHDPGSGAWHDVPTMEAPGWTKWEARKRKQLYRAGDRHAYELTRKHMEQIYRDERHKDEGIVEEYPVEEELEK
jgi:hypothetical protein